MSKELADFLIEFSIGVHRYAMYPRGHPSLQPAVEGIVRRLVPLFIDRATLSIGVARRQLVIEGVATDEGHPVLSELARRLHDLQLGALTFEVGVDGDEIIELLGTLAEELEPDELPLGLKPQDQLPSWTHIRVHPLGYERLAIKDREGDLVAHDRATRLWLGLAQAALAGQEVTEEIEGDPKRIARSIQEHRREAAYDQVIVGYMLQLAAELKTERGAEAERVRRRLTGLVREMEEGTLSRLVELGGDLSARKRFVLDANECLAVDAVVKVLRAAAEASEQTVSHSMTRLLTKLAQHADRGAGRLRTQAGSALRENVEELLEDWDLADPNPGEYTRVLDAIAKAAPIFGANETAGLEAEDEVPGPLRLLEMALEVDAYGPTVQAAILDLVELGYSATMLQLAKDAPEGTRLAAKIVAELTGPDRVRAYLERPDVDEEALAGLAESMGADAIPVFLDALADSESRSVRRKVFDRARLMGGLVGVEVVRRLEGEERWYVVRNWLALLEFFPEAAAGIDALRYLHHEDPRVRREALTLALRAEGSRDRALALALADPDELNCRTAVVELRAPVPETLVPTIVKRVLHARRDSVVKAQAIRALEGSRAPLVRDALVALVAVGRSMLGKVKLHEPDPAMLAALRVLATDWRTDAAVAPIVEQAARSKLPAVSRAAAGVGE